MKLELEEIGIVESCFDEKFGVPRQPGLAKKAWGRLIFHEPFRNANMLDGLERFSHLWLTFLFHQIHPEQQKEKVRPPRLGGNASVGVWASRSPFRPNRLGLSVVQLDRVELETDRGPILHLSGVDLVNGTPILDIKPYVAYSDAPSDVVSGFAPEPPEELSVEFSLNPGDCNDDFKSLVEDILRFDVRPAFHSDPERIYGMSIEGRNVRFKIVGCKCIVVTVSSLS